MVYYFCLLTFLLSGSSSTSTVYLSFPNFIFRDIFFAAPRNPFYISSKATFVLLNSFSFCLSVKYLISPSSLNYSLQGRVLLVVDVFIILNILCCLFLAYRVSTIRSAYKSYGS